MSANRVPLDFWEQRAARFASNGAGLAAVCAYGMPRFYNACIDWTQQRALRPWIGVEPDADVLDVGCGVGRWSVRLARAGGRVTGVDWSETMLAEARRRAAAAGVATRCDFHRQDLSALATGRKHALILGVTVLQHILEPARLDEAVRRLAAHLAPGGRLVLLEVAPSRIDPRCDTETFRARTASDYLRRFTAHGLAVEAVTGVDPMPLRIRLLPYNRRLPRLISAPLFVGAAAVSWPLDALLARRLTAQSWHKVFVLRHHDDEAGRA